jgi:hypothetical protein
MIRKHGIDGAGMGSLAVPLVSETEVSCQPGLLGDIRLLTLDLLPSSTLEVGSLTGPMAHLQTLLGSITSLDRCHQILTRYLRLHSSDDRRLLLVVRPQLISMLRQSPKDQQVVFG